jgi:hypothetical protein
VAILSLDPSGTARQRWSNRWRAALNASEIAFDGRLRSDAGWSGPVKTADAH